MSDRDKVLEELKKFLAENPGSGEAVAKLIVAIIALTFYMKIYSGIVVYQLIDYLRKKLGVILARSKSVKVKDVKKQYFILLPLFLKLIEDDKKYENEEDEDEEIETSLEKLQLL